MRVQLQPAYVLFSQPFQNTSLMVDLFTLEYGRVRAIAKGARREKSKYRALLQPFQPLLIGFSGRGDVKTLGGVEAGHNAIFLKGERIFSGLYLNEILCRLLQNHEEHLSLYKTYQDTLVALQGSGNTEITLRKFELNLLAELGYAIDLQEDYLTRKPIEKGKRYRFSPDAGFELDNSSETENNIDNVFDGSDLIALREFSFNEKTVARSAKRLLRLALRVHLGEKPLHSRNLFVTAR
jgi:DNA repair protein RecO (recombination protein O)